MFDKEYFSLLICEVTFVLIESLLTILFIETSTSGIYLILNPRSASEAHSSKDNHCQLDFEILLVFFIPTEMNNPSCGGHKDYLSV